MHRIDTEYATLANLFTEGNPSAGQPATRISDDWLNDLQEELCSLIEAAGISLVKGNRTQLAAAIRSTAFARFVSVKDPEFGAVGDGVADDTEAIQNAINAASGGVLLMQKPDIKFMVSSPLTVPSNTAILCDPGVVIETAAGEFGTADAIFKIDSKDNVTIIGNGAILRGLREGTGTDLISMGCSVTGSTNVRLLDLVAEDCSGDGFYIAGADDNTPDYSDNVHLVRCRSDNCMRQGLSIVSVRNLWVVDSAFNNTNGKLPGAGIDIEPDPTGDLININIINTKAAANEGAGYQVELNSIQGDISIKFQNCKAFGGISAATATGFRVSDSRYNYAQGMGVLIDDCEAIETYSYGALLYNINKAAAPVVMRRFRSVNCNTSQTSAVSAVPFQNAQVGIFAVNNAVYPNPGNIRIEDLTIIEDTADRSPFAIQSNGAPHDGVLILGIKWISSVGAATIPYADDAITNCRFEWSDGPFKWNRNTNINLTARYNGFLFHNAGDTNGVAYTLPAVAAGLAYRFECVAAQPMQIDCSASDRLRPYGAADGKYMETSTPGSTAYIYANADATDWVVQRFGAWSDEP